MTSNDTDGSPSQWPDLTPDRLVEGTEVIVAVGGVGVEVSGIEVGVMEVDVIVNTISVGVDAIEVGITGALHPTNMHIHTMKTN